MKKPENPPAFPTETSGGCIGSDGMTLLDYFIAHAPAEPQWEFCVKMDSIKPEPITKLENTAPLSPTTCINQKEVSQWDEKYTINRLQQWATEWAKEQLKQRQNYLKI